MFASRPSLPEWRTVQRKLPLMGNWLAFVVFVEGEVFNQRHLGDFLRQFIVHNGLFGLTALSLYICANRAPGSPPDAYAQGGAHAERSRPPGQRYEQDDQLEADFRGISLAEWIASKSNRSQEQYEAEHMDDEDDVPLVNLLNKNERSGMVNAPIPTLTVKGSSGGVRWCRKCQAVKPDRCHHCSTCGTCVLMMDHHCVWVAGCIGYRNKKPFLLFLLYAALYAADSGLEAGKVCVDFFESGMAKEGSEIELKPVIWILLTLAGFIFFLTLAPFAAFHFYLVYKNVTTLEHMRPAYPNLKLENLDPAKAVEAQPHPAAPRRPSLDIRRDAGWRPDHMLSRDERRRAKRISESINPFDLGWMRNFSQIFDPDEEGLGWRWMWPASRGGSSDRLAGQVFPYSPHAVERLREETARLRLGRDYREISDV